MLLASACSKDEPTNSVSDQPTKVEEPSEATDETSETATTASGEEIFQQSCIKCHSSGDLTGGQNLLDATRIQNDFKEETELHTFVSTNMPKSAPGSLSAEEYDNVVDYLWGQQK